MELDVETLGEKPEKRVFFFLRNNFVLSVSKKREVDPGVAGGGFLVFMVKCCLKRARCFFCSACLDCLWTMVRWTFVFYWLPMGASFFCMICLIAEMVFFVPGKIHDVLLKIIVEEDGFQESDPIFIGFTQGSLNYQFFGDQTVQRYI